MNHIVTIVNKEIYFNKLNSKLNSNLNSISVVIDDRILYHIRVDSKIISFLQNLFNISNILEYLKYQKEFLEYITHIINGHNYYIYYSLTNRQVLDVSNITINEIKQIKLNSSRADIYDFRPDDIVTYINKLGRNGTGVPKLTLQNLRNREQGPNKRRKVVNGMSGGGKYIVLQSNGRKIRKKIYMIDGKEKICIDKNKYVSVQTYKKNICDFNLKDIPDIIGK
jgi:hypothetical protein